MDTTAKMDAATKKRLERLRASVSRQLGRAVTQRELLELLVNWATRDPAAVAFEVSGRKYSFGPKEFEELTERCMDFGVRSREKEVDLYLYGWKK